MNDAIRQWKRISKELGIFYQQTKSEKILLAFEWINEGIRNMMREPAIVLLPKNGTEKVTASVSDIADKTRSLAFDIMRLKPVYQSGSDPRIVLMSKNTAYQHLLEYVFELEPTPTRSQKLKRKTL